MQANTLFLCTGNSACSQMAEAFLRQYGSDRFEAYSAGLVSSEINPHTIQVMEEIGISLGCQHSKSKREYLGKEHFGYIITVCDYVEENCPTTFLGVGKRMHWSFEDPAAFEGTEQEKLEKFREIHDQIAHRVQTWLGEVAI